MSNKKMDARGFTHGVVLLLFVVIFSIVGVGFLVYSHADTTVPTAQVAPPPAGNWSYIGKVAVPVSGAQYNVSAWACKFSTNFSTANTWEIKGYFGLGTQTDSPSLWQGVIHNGSANPYPNYTNASMPLSNPAVPSATVTSFVYSNYDNYLVFAATYSGGQQHIITSNVRPGNLVPCASADQKVLPPTGLRYNTSSTFADLFWTQSADTAVGRVAGYDVFYTTNTGAAATEVKVPLGTTTEISGLTPKTSYTFYMESYDPAGVTSVPSASVKLTTL